MQPACVDACPTDALVFGDMADPSSEIATSARDLNAAPFKPGEANLKKGVLYVAHESWQESAVNKGCELDPRDPDIIYEQR